MHLSRPAIERKHAKNTKDWTTLIIGFQQKSKNPLRDDSELHEGNTSDFQSPLQDDDDPPKPR
jgi:hypothetical protein